MNPNQKAATFTEQVYFVDAYIESSELTKEIVLVTDESDTGVIEIKGVDLRGAMEEWFSDWRSCVQAFMSSNERLKYFVNQPLNLIK